MTKHQANHLKIVLAGLMRRYQERVPDVKTIITAMIDAKMIEKEPDIINDHIAFRTLGIEALGIKSLEKIFLSLGYQKKDQYFFPKKKLEAYWYAPPKTIPNLPRIFISECQLDQFSDFTQKTIKRITNHIKSDPVNDLDLSDPKAIDSFLHAPLWEPPTWEVYQKLQKESEYIAWVMNNRYYLNHFTISIHALKDGFNNIESYNDFLEKTGIKLNDSGGKIKISQDGLLKQSASVAKEVKVNFLHEDGQRKKHDIPGSYVEFAQRIDGRDGFDSSNADKIFESTYSDQVDQKK